MATIRDQTNDKTFLRDAVFIVRLGDSRAKGFGSDRFLRHNRLALTASSRHAPGDTSARFTPQMARLSRGVEVALSRHASLASRMQQRRAIVNLEKCEEAEVTPKLIGRGRYFSCSARVGLVRLCIMTLGLWIFWG